MIYYDEEATHYEVWVRWKVDKPIASAEAIQKLGGIIVKLNLGGYGGTGKWLGWAGWDGG